jgi:hypothetical protein
MTSSIASNHGNPTGITVLMQKGTTSKGMKANRFFGKRLATSEEFDGFGGLVVSVLASGSRVRGFESFRVEQRSEVDARECAAKLSSSELYLNFVFCFLSYFYSLLVE